VEPPNCANCPWSLGTVERVGAFNDAKRPNNLPRMFAEVLCTPTTPTCRTLEHRNVLTHELAEFIARHANGGTAPAKYFALMNGYLVYISREEIDFARYESTRYTGTLKPCDGNKAQTCGANRVFEVFRVVQKGQ
jgi:hypothetical protein